MARYTGKIKCLQKSRMPKERTVVTRPMSFGNKFLPQILTGTKTVTRRMAREPFCTIMDSEPTPREFREMLAKCPYGQKGDRLYIRESWSYGIELDVDERPKVDKSQFMYKSDPGEVEYTGHSWYGAEVMPEKAARYFLKITGIRIERLHEMKYQDAVKEGMNPDVAPMAEFIMTWDEIFGENAWYLNPWVWVIEFEYEKPPEKKKKNRVRNPNLIYNQP